jgi:hypothetical protein
VALTGLNPAARRIAILISELMVFLIGSAFTAYFLSHAGALQLAAGDATPAQFPVIAYEGDRSRPQAENYKVMQWQEWETFAAAKPGASLLLPERAASNIKIGDSGEASFTATDEDGSRQNVELTWRTTGGEQVARYIALDRGIEARYLRTLGSQTLFMSVLAGFVAGLMVGRVLRKRWLAVPGTFAPPEPK